MVASLIDVLTPLGAMAPAAPDMLTRVGSTAPHLPDMGTLLCSRASSLSGVRLGGVGIPSMRGTPVRFLEPTLGNTEYCFMRKRIFALIAADGSLFLRAPAVTADDLVENGLCIRAGKNLHTWTPRNQYQFEVVWRILLQAYWSVSAISADRPYRLWSEWAAIHTYRKL